MSPAAWLVVVLGLWARPSSASSLLHRPLHQRAQSADVIAFVQVLGQRLDNARVEPRRLQTVTHFSVAEYWKGRGPSTLEVIQWGGTQGLWKTHVAGDARFVPGETAVVLLRCQGKTAWGRCRLVALAEGKIRIAGNDAFVFLLSSGKEERVSLTQLRKELGLASVAPKVSTPEMAR